MASATKPEGSLSRRHASEQRGAGTQRAQHEDSRGLAEADRLCLRGGRVNPYHFSKIGLKEIFILPALSLVRTREKATLKEFETDIKMAPSIDGSFKI